MSTPRPRSRTTSAVQERAREPRHEMTPAERLVWRHLRGNRLAGLHSRRQHPIDRFIVDFCCIEHKLVVEVDGPIHAGQVEDDAYRTGCLEELGYRVIRFTNRDVLRRLPTVLKQINAPCHPQASSPLPSHGGHGGRHPELCSPLPSYGGGAGGGGFPHIYISPHLDDVVYSCGGRIWQQVQAGERPLVVTVFAATPSPDAPLSPFAQGLHARWGHPDDAAVTRQAEDVAALACLGAAALHWPYTDCIYRQTPDGRFPYDSEESLWAKIHREEYGLVAELHERLAALPLAAGGTLYAPLGLGHHVDHRIVRWAAAGLPCHVAYYEDFPYAEDAQELEAALAGGASQAELTTLSEAALQAKIAAVACYESQISTFWSGLEEMAARVRAFAEGIGAGQPAERYWETTEPLRG